MPMVRRSNDGMVHAFLIRRTRPPCRMYRIRAYVPSALFSGDDPNDRRTRRRPTSLGRSPIRSANPAVQAMSYVNARHVCDVDFTNTNVSNVSAPGVGQRLAHDIGRWPGRRWPLGLRSTSLTRWPVRKRTRSEGAVGVQCQRRPQGRCELGYVYDAPTLSRPAPRGGRR
jgi:hypothetical protein